MNVHPDARDGNENWDDEQRKAIARKDEGEREEEPPEERRMSGRKGVPVAGEEFPIPISGLDDLEGAQALKDFFQSGDGEASRNLRTADEQQDPGDRSAGLRDKQDRAQA